MYKVKQIKSIKSFLDYKEKYGKKYSRLLLSYTKEDLNRFDRINNCVGSNHLLEGRKWILLKDTYYEIPGPIRASWFRGLNAGVRLATGVVLVSGIGGAAAYGYFAFAGSIKYVTVTFDLNGGKGEIQSQKIRSGSKVKKPEILPTKERFTFFDWCINPTDKTTFDFETKITSDITIYAGWTFNGDVSETEWVNAFNYLQNKETRNFTLTIDNNSVIRVYKTNAHFVKELLQEDYFKDIYWTTNLNNYNRVSLNLNEEKTANPSKLESILNNYMIEDYTYSLFSYDASQRLYTKGNIKVKFNSDLHIEEIVNDNKVSVFSNYNNSEVEVNPSNRFEISGSGKFVYTSYYNKFNSTIPHLTYACVNSLTGFDKDQNNVRFGSLSGKEKYNVTYKSMSELTVYKISKDSTVTLLERGSSEGDKNYFIKENKAYFCKGTLETDDVLVFNLRTNMSSDDVYLQDCFTYE